MEGKVRINLRSFSDMRDRLVVVSPTVTLAQLLLDGGCKLKLKAVEAFKELDHARLVPFVEGMPVEKEMILILTRRNETIPSRYRLLDREPVKVVIERKKTAVCPVEWKPEEKSAIPISASDRLFIEESVKNGVVGMKGNSAYVQFNRGQAGRIIGRNGSTMDRLRCACPNTSEMYFDSSTLRLNIYAANEDELFCAIHVVLQERSSIESFGPIQHSHVREVTILRRGFGPIMGIGGAIKHDIQNKHSVRLGFDMKTFVVRIVGGTQQNVENALREVQERLKTRAFERVPSNYV